MKGMKFVLWVSLLMLSVSVLAVDWQDSTAVDQLFRNANETGTFVLYDVIQRRWTGHNRERAYTRFVPASTFKVTNTLVGLSVGAVRSMDEVLPYGGSPCRLRCGKKT